MTPNSMGMDLNLKKGKQIVGQKRFNIVKHTSMLPFYIRNVCELLTQLNFFLLPTSYVVWFQEMEESSDSATSTRKI